jgi:hypothetical protein
MSTASVALPAQDRDVAAKVLLAGALVGVLDGFSAWFYVVVVLQKSTLLRVFQGIAGALLGQESFNGGVPTFLLGVAMHFTVAYGWTMVYYLIWKNWPALQRLVRTTAGAVMAGVLYGPFVHLMMKFVILPFTKAGSGPTPPLSRFLAMMLIHVVAVGVPIAVIVRRREAKP